MDARHCVKCGKVLPTNTLAEQCSLCAIGLTPTEPVYDFGAAAAPPPVDSRVLSGSHCPYCHAEMTIADLSRRSCSICGALVAPDALRLRTGPITAQMPPPRVSAGDAHWPDDAPLW